MARLGFERVIYGGPGFSFMPRRRLGFCIAASRRSFGFHFGSPMIFDVTWYRGHGVRLHRRGRSTPL